MSHLKQLMASHGITQTGLAQILGRDKSVITNLFQGRRQLKADEAMLIARHIGVPVTQVLGVPPELKGGAGMYEPPVLIPFQHEPTPGKKRLGVVKRDGRSFLEVAEGSGYTPKAYALEVADDSMNLSGILPGDVVISELDRACKPGQVVVAQHYQGKGAKTVIRRWQPPFLMPHSTAPGFRPLNAEEGEVRLVSPVLKLIRAF